MVNPMIQPKEEVHKILLDEYLGTAKEKVLVASKKTSNLMSEFSNAQLAGLYELALSDQLSTEGLDVWDQEIEDVERQNELVKRYKKRWKEYKHGRDFFEKVVREINHLQDDAAGVIENVSDDYQAVYREIIPEKTQLTKKVHLELVRYYLTQSIAFKKSQM